MKRLRGTIHREDLSGGYLVLIGDDGVRYLLGGATKALREEGARVELEGEPRGDVASIAASAAPVFWVKSSRRL